jgi:undecaprenyl-diphosphatase
MAAVLAAGRVFLGLHYPSDVLAGAALGTAAALLLWLPAPRALLERVAAVPERIGRRRPAAA